MGGSRQAVRVQQRAAGTVVVEPTHAQQRGLVGSNDGRPPGRDSR